VPARAPSLPRAPPRQGAHVLLPHPHRLPPALHLRAGPHVALQAQAPAATRRAAHAGAGVSSRSTAHCRNEPSPPVHASSDGAIYVQTTSRCSPSLRLCSIAASSALAALLTASLPLTHGGVGTHAGGVRGAVRHARLQTLPRRRVQGAHHSPHAGALHRAVRLLAAF
jgi:hypothetical protein